MDDSVSDLPEPDAAALRAAAEQVLDRLLDLAASLGPTERSVLAALLAPAIALADDDDVVDVAGFAADADVTALPPGVGETVRARRMRIVDPD